MVNNKNKVQVMIEGRIMTLMGVETEEYMRSVAAYIDNKMNEIKSADVKRTLNPATASILTSINIADDFFKQKEVTESREKENKDLKAKVKHLQDENGSMKTSFAEAKSNIDKLQEENEGIKTAFAEVQNEIEQLKKNLTDLENEKKKSEAEKAAEKEAERAAEAALRAESLLEAEEEIDHLKKEVERLEKEKEAAEKELDEYITAFDSGAANVAQKKTYKIVSNRKHK